MSRDRTKMTSSATSFAPPSLGGQLWRYGVTGLINTGLGLFIILTLHIGFDVGILASNAVGYGAGLLCSFTLNRSWTFASQEKILSSGLKYAVLIGIAFALCLFAIACLQAANAPYLVAQSLGTALYSIVVFLGAKHVVFSH